MYKDFTNVEADAFDELLVDYACGAGPRFCADCALSISNMNSDGAHEPT
jgi:hypothetical protein